MLDKLILTAGAAFGIAFLVMSAQNIWWYGRLWWRMLDGAPFGVRLVRFIVPPPHANGGDSFDPQILGSFNSQIGVFLWIVLALFISKERPTSWWYIALMLVGDYYMFTSMVYKLMPAWRLKGRSNRRITAEIAVRIGIALAIAFTSVELGAR